MQLQGKRVLVTGAGGFVGSHLTERLLRLGCPVRAFVKYNSRNDYRFLAAVPPELKDGLELIPGDILDPDSLLKACRDVEAVFHLAAHISIPYSYLHPREVAETNAMGTLNVLQAAREAGVRKVVHTSTSEVYGTARTVPIDEGHPLQPQSPYSASKIAADQIALSFHRSFDCPVAVIRPFNQYGPRQSARAVIPATIIQALTRDRIRLGALTPTRDFTFVEDTVEAYLRIAASDATSGEEINVGTGRETSIEAVARMIMRIIGRELEIVCDAQRLRPQKSEVFRLVCDYGKAKALVGWEPAVTLEQGLEKTVRWIEANPGLFQPDAYVV